MTLKIALLLSADGIALAHRQEAGHWAMVGETAFDTNDLGAAMDGLRSDAETRAGAGFKTLLILPDDQILYTSLTAPTADPELTAYRIEDGLDGLTPYAVTELEYDWRVIEEDRVKIAVVARETLDEAIGFAKQYGFECAGFAAMPPMERFPATPCFDIADAGLADDLRSNGLAFGPDQFGLPVAPDRSPQAAPEPEAEAAPEAPPEAAKSEATSPDPTDLAPPEADATQRDSADSAATRSDITAPALSDVTAPAPVPAAEPDSAPAPDAEPEGDTALTAPIRIESTPQDPSPGGGTAPEPAEAAPQSVAPRAVMPGPLAQGPDASEPEPVESAPPRPADPAKTDEASPLPAEEADPSPVEAATLSAAETDPQITVGRNTLAGAPPLDTPPAPQEPPADALLDHEPLQGEDPLPPAPSPAALAVRNRLAEKRSPEPAGGASAPKPTTPSQATSSDPTTPAATGDAAPKRRSGALAVNPDQPGSLVGKVGRRIDLGAAPRDGQSEDSTQVSAPIDSAPVERAQAAGMSKLAEHLERVRRVSQRPGQDAAPDPDAAAPPPHLAATPPAGVSTSGNAAPTVARPFNSPLVSPDTAYKPGPPDAPSGRSRLSGALRSGLASVNAGVASVSAKAGPGISALMRRAAGSARAEAGTAPAGDVEESSQATPHVSDLILEQGMMARRTTARGVGPSLRTGVILTAILLVLLAIVAVWSVLFLPNSPVARFFGISQSTSTASFETDAPQVSAEAPVIGGVATTAQPDIEEEAAADGITLAALEPRAEPGLSDTAGAAELADIDAEIDLPPLPAIDGGDSPTLEEAEALYAADRIWARAPERPVFFTFDLYDEVYTPSLDAEVMALDALALADPGVNPGELLRRFPDPPPFGTIFDLTEQGLISPTPDGVMTPEGAFVILGRPPIEPVPRPREIAAPTPVAAAGSAAEGADLATLQPQPRPDNLDELLERQRLGGLSAEELAQLRPPLRPSSPQELAASASLFEDGPEDGGADPGPGATGTALAVASSLVPPTRPVNIEQIVASAERLPTAPATAVALEAVAPAPSIPSNADVARAATTENAIRLRNVNLIGVTGSTADRRALVRLPSGRFVRVGVGDTLDGGRVAAIGETTLQYVRNGRTLTLEVPG